MSCTKTPSVHPRLRGELWQRRYLAVVLCGSSPLTRGTPDEKVDDTLLDRFIPAYAGNSQNLCTSQSVQTVHPRLRGELMRPALITRLKNGSSPLTRGTLSGVSAITINDRFIPAYAGNSYQLVQHQRKGPVHPRLRGELAVYNGVAPTDGGSSPLTRGTRTITGATLGSGRFIPAYAGNSQIGVTSTGFPTVHPRLRGELCPVHG